jgi:hypothetical protein
MSQVKPLNRSNAVTLLLEQGDGVETEFDSWLRQVRVVLDSIGMPMDKWQQAWPFDFAHEFEVNTIPREAALKANKLWWQQQNRAIGQECRIIRDCWLPRGHEGECEPI